MVKTRPRGVDVHVGRVRCLHVYWQRTTVAQEGSRDDETHRGDDEEELQRSAEDASEDLRQGSKPREVPLEVEVTRMHCSGGVDESPLTKHAVVVRVQTGNVRMIELSDMMQSLKQNPVVMLQHWDLLDLSNALVHAHQAVPTQEWDHLEVCPY